MALIRTLSQPAATIRSRTRGRLPLVLTWMVAAGWRARIAAVASTTARPRVSASPSHPWPKETMAASSPSRKWPASPASSATVGAKPIRSWGEGTAPSLWREMQPRQSALQAGDAGRAAS